MLNLRAREYYKNIPRKENGKYLFSKNTIAFTGTFERYSKKKLYKICLCFGWIYTDRVNNNIDIIIYTEKAKEVQTTKYKFGIWENSVTMMSEREFYRQLKLRGVE